MYLLNDEAHYFYTTGTERMRLNASGQALIGTTVVPQSGKFAVSSGISSSSGQVIEMQQATNGANKAAAAFGMAIGNGGEATNAADLTFLTASGGALGERMRVTSAGTFYLGKTGTNFEVNGFEVTTGVSGFAALTNSRTDSDGDLLLLNRQGSDGPLIRFGQAGTIEGTITVSGTTVSYNGGHLARWSQLADNTRDNTILKGTVLTNLDKMASWFVSAVDATYYTEDEELPEDVSVGDEKTAAVAEHYQDNEQLNCMAVSSVEGDANVAGVFVNWDEVSDGFNDMNIAMTGDMIIRIAQGTTVARGDLLMSAGDGTAKPQGDDIVRGKTIAKITSTHVTCTYDDGSFCVPCVLMAC
tara:strand:- start:57 stop:1127 length:1071 start_codon:yes stop_codon:yes gene_type:complete